jgi:riboflavin synthase
MFTGIVEERGAVARLDGARLTVRSDVATRDASIGDSIAVNGACLTVVDLGAGAVGFDLSSETFARTTLGALVPGDLVNLERPATLASRLGGHLVQGHVDGIAEVLGLRHGPTGGAVMTVRLPAELLRYVVEKGSIALDGVSLTVAAIADDAARIALIPHTLAATTLGAVVAGDRLNVEVDVVAKYVASMIRSAPGRTEARGATTDERRASDRQEERSA